MLKIKINNDKILDYNQEKDLIQVNNEPLQLDILPVSENIFHLIHENRSFNAEVIDFNAVTKTYRLKVDGIILEAQVKDRLDLIMDKMGISENVGLKIPEIKAPMPGLILDIKVKEGQEVQTGENLVILEAMKMENIIKSPRGGIIKRIKVKQGESVDKNQILLEFSN